MATCQQPAVGRCFYTRHYKLRYISCCHAGVPAVEAWTTTKYRAVIELPMADRHACSSPCVVPQSIHDGATAPWLTRAAACISTSFMTQAVKLTIAVSTRQLWSVLLPPTGQQVCNRGLFGMTIVCQNLATAHLLIHEQLRGCRLPRAQHTRQKKRQTRFLQSRPEVVL